MTRLKLLSLIFVVLVGLSGCNYEGEAESSEISVKIYLYNQNDSLFEATEYKTEKISMNNLSADTVKFMTLYNGIQIDKVWYEGDRLCVDLNLSERFELDRGSTAGMLRKDILLKTFSSYPNVKEIKILIGGERGCIGDHFMFDEIFEVIE